jgi:2-methylcitrate dehydratase PrpD
MLLLGREPGPAWHAPGLTGAAEVRAAMARISVVHDPGLEALFEERSIVGAQVRVTGPDGTEDEARVETTYGDVQQPMTDSDLDRKFRRLADGVIPGPNADAALEFIWNLERLDRIGALTALLEG